MTLPVTCPRCGGSSWAVALNTSTWQQYRECNARLHHYMAPWPAMGILTPSYPTVANLCGFRTDLDGNVLPVLGEEMAQ